MKSEVSFSEAGIYTFKVCREPYFAVISTSGNGKQSTCRFMCRNCRLCTKFFKSAFQDFCTILLKGQYQTVQLKWEILCLSPVRLSGCLSLHTSVCCLYVFLSVCLFIGLSVHLSVCQYVRLSVCPLLSFCHASFHSLCLSSVDENEKDALNIGVYGTYSRNEDPVPAPLTERETLRHHATRTEFVAQC